MKQSRQLAHSSVVPLMELSESKKCFLFVVLKRFEIISLRAKLRREIWIINLLKKNIMYSNIDED